MFAIVRRTHVRVKSGLALNRLGRPGGFCEELSGPPDELAVGVDLTLGTQVTDEVPMQARVVESAELLEGRAERDVHGAADLLVEERVIGEAVDLVVQTERDLAETARALVHLQEGIEEGAAAPSLRLHDPSALEPQSDVLDLAALEERREGEADLPCRLGLDGARVDLAVRHVVAPVGGLPAA